MNDKGLKRKFNADEYAELMSQIDKKSRYSERHK
jgi:hypothetical protein